MLVCGKIALNDTDVNPFFLLGTPSVNKCKPSAEVADRDFLSEPTLFTERMKHPLFYSLVSIVLFLFQFS